MTTICFIQAYERDYWIQIFSNSSFFILKQFIWLWDTFTDCSFANMRTFKHQIMTLVSNNYNIGLVIVEWEWWLEMWTTCRIRVINKARQWEPDLINEVSTNEKIPSPSFERMYTTIYSLHTFYISPRFISQMDISILVYLVQYF